MTRPAAWPRSTKTSAAGLARAIGRERERRAFRPHITVARRSSWASPACGEPTPPLVFDPEAVTLCRSRPTPGGAENQPPVRVGLDGTAVAPTR